MQSERSRILKLLDIDVWVSRGKGGHQGLSESVSASAPGAAVAPAADPGDGVSALTRQVRETLREPVEGRHKRAPSAPPVQPSVPPAEPMADKPAADSAPDLPDTQILSLRCSGLLLLVEVQGLKYARRLATDLLRAAAGDWQSALEQTVFDWHPDKVGSAGVSGRRALAAFVDKQLDDLGREKSVLLCERVAAMLPELAGSLSSRDHHTIRVPALQALAGDGEAKRILWQQIQQLTSR